MAKETGHNKKKKESKKKERLKRLFGIDLCACAYQLQCYGICRRHHVNFDTGKIECGELYQIDHSIVKKEDDSCRSKRTWKYGRQKEGDENTLIKQQRRKKMERDQSRGV